jgi:hypothetical protein
MFGKLDPYFPHALTVSPLDFTSSADAGNGSNDDTAAVLAALQSGYPVDGGERIYAVAGTLQPSSFTGIRRLRLKQLTPKAGDTGGDQANTTVKTLYIVGFNKVDIDRLEIDCGGDFTAGYVSPSFNIYGAGLKVQDSSNVRITNCEIFNGGTINGIQVQGSAAQVGNVTINNNIVRDLHWSAGSVPSDDVINGIWVYNAADVDYRSNKIYRLYGYLNGNPLTPSHQRSRGHVFSLIRGLVSTGNIVDRVDQGFDHTGSDGVRGASFTANYASNCCSAGFKWANSQRHGSIIGNVAEDCGRFGFIFSPKSGDGTEPDPGYMDVVGNRAINPGKPSIVDGNSYIAGYSAGFDIENDHPENGMWPRGIRFANNTAYDDQVSPTMQYGLYCGIESSGYGFQGIEAINFNSIGHTIATTGPANSGGHVYGPHRPLVIVNSLAAAGGQSVSNNTWTSLDFTTDPDPEDTLACHDHSTNANIVKSPIEGWSLVVAHARFSSNSTGIRGVRLLVNGTEIIPNGRAFLNAINGDDTYLTLHVPVRLAKGDSLRTEVYQSSGGTLSCVSHQLAVTSIGVHSSHA